MSLSKATFAAGCFWGVEHKFRQVKGVINAISGYIGGNKDHPTYKDVCTGKTYHAEAVEIVFDPQFVSYESLLDVFWNIHDPTQLNRQGPDIGTQYRSAIFYHDETQKVLAEASLLKIQTRFQRPIVTQITDATTFWPAEEYHQQYIEKNGGVCHI